MGRFGRDFGLYFTSQVVSQLGTSFTQFALPLLVFKLTGSATNLAITTAATFVPYLLFGLVLGAVADQVDRKRMMVGVDLVRAGVVAVLPILSVADQLEVWHIYVVAFALSTVGILFDCGEFAAVPSLVPSDDLVTANGWIMATNSAGQVLGPVVAGLLLALVPVAQLLFVDSATFLLSALALMSIRRSFNTADAPAADDGDGPAAVGRIRSVFRDVGVGLRYVLGNPVLRTISLMMAIINFVGVTQGTQLVLFAKERLAATDAEVGVLYAAGSAGVVVVGLAAGAIRRRLSFVVTALGALVVSGLALAAMGLVRSFPVALVLWAAASGFGLLLNINTGALRQAIVPPHLFGRVISIAGVLAWSAIPLGALAGAAVIEATDDIAAVYVGIGLLTAVIAAGFALSPIREGDRYLAAAKAAGAAADDDDASLTAAP
ncbi:MAG: MFS transporter [Actinomycetota bacterium]|nr:MFS transporter [Acidimicrobiia bacterium]MDQ3293383.1 MFS transporter [Actinomycetota bacterium]